MLDRRLLILGRFVWAAALAAACGSAGSQEFPTRTVRIVSAFPPGGGPDVASRILASVIAPALGQQVIVENRPGGGGTLGANVVAKSAADGHTLLATDHASGIYGGALYKQLPYDPAKDLAIVTPLLRAAFVFFAGPALKATNFREFVAEAKANPGRIQYGHPGVGTAHHLTVELFSQRMGLEMAAIAYKGVATLAPEVAGGQIAWGIAGHVSTVGLVKAGKVRAIAVTSRERWAPYPNVPTVAEFLPGFEAFAFVTLFAPTGTPRDALARLNSEVTRALRNPDVIRKFEEVGFDPAPGTLEESNQLVQRELAVWPDVIRRLKISLD